MSTFVSPAPILMVVVVVVGGDGFHNARHSLSCCVGVGAGTSTVSKHFAVCNRELRQNSIEKVPRY